MVDQFAKLRTKLIEHEGVRNFAYTDTRGNLTIGVGRTISVHGEGLSLDEIYYLLNNDILRVHKTLSVFPWFESLNNIRQDVMMELAFNLGIEGLLNFKEMILAIKDGDYATAGLELKRSLWSTEVGVIRTQDLYNRLCNGVY